MTANQIVDGILRREGGFVHHQADKGGATNRGITAATLGEFRRLGRPATPDEVQAMAEDEARLIYTRRYLAPWRWVQEPLRILLIDWGVTTSHPNVIKGLQRALAEQGEYDGLIDGIAGTKTRQAVERADDWALYLRVLEQREAFYLDLAFDAQTMAFLRDHPKTQLHFARGWLSRCREFRWMAPAP